MKKKKGIQNTHNISAYRDMDVFTFRAMKDKVALIFSLFIYPARYKSDRFAFDRTRHTMTATTPTAEFGSGDRDDLDACLA
jgi:hypothetical protein